MSTAGVEKTRRRTKNQGRREEIEEWLDSHGVEWDYVSSVKTEEFDVEKGLANQARIFNPLDEATVETYAEAIKRGDPFPAVVAARASARGTLVIADGPVIDGVMLGNPSYEALGVALDLQDAQLAWRASLATQRAFLAAYGPATANAYRADLKDLNRFAAQRGVAPLELTRTDLQAYLRHLLDGRGLSPGTARRRAAAIRGWCTWLVREELLDRSPTEHLRLPQRRPAVPRLRLTTTEMVMIIGAAEEHSSRAAAAVHLLAHGLRVSEAADLDVEDALHGAVPSVRVRGKGGSGREVQLTSRAARWVLDLAAERPSGPLLRSQRSDGRLHRTDIARLLRIVASGAMPAERAARVHPHALRRCFAATCHQAGLPLRDLQHALGHATPQMAMTYADEARHHDGVVPAHLDQALRAAGPALSREYRADQVQDARG